MLPPLNYLGPDLSFRVLKARNATITSIEDCEPEGKKTYQEGG